LLDALVLTLSPAVRARSWQVIYRWDHWIGVLFWGLSFGVAHYSMKRKLDHYDPFLLPIFALLSGLGMLTIWRLLPDFGLRQSVWILLTVLILMLGLNFPNVLTILRQYKYLWLTASLLLTALTLVFGTNPLGYGPRMWLGCCGIYLQPSEPLKLLLIAYMASYMADKRLDLTLSQSQNQTRLFSKSRLMLALLLPTFLMSGMALILLLVQRDLGTASILLLIYTALIYLMVGDKKILIGGLVVLAISAALGYLLFEIVQIRVDSWLFPWSDPSGRSYQIVQSLIAIANGGLIGRGLGIGNPGLVPIAHSDLIYAALGEEYGLLGIIAIVLVIAILAIRGLKIALNARNTYQRYLAVGLTIYLSGQSLLIIGGSVRIFPLTGVTLPFISYGGSSLLVSALAILLLIHISASMEDEYRPKFNDELYLQTGKALLAGFISLSLVSGWWVIIRGSNLLSRTDNARRSISDRYVHRGTIFDRDLDPINTSFGESGNYNREYLFPSLSNIIGYTSPVFGQAGLEASMDDYLRGLRGNPNSLVWWNQLLYGQPPPGIDIRLTIDLDLQHRIDQKLKDRTAAIVMIDNSTGELYSMASYPGFDANQLSEQWETYTSDESSPYLNRAYYGYYPIGDIADKLSDYLLPDRDLTSNSGIRLTSLDARVDQSNGLYLNPFEAALIASTISNAGEQPAPQIVSAVNTQKAGWVPLDPLSEPHSVFSDDIVEFRQKQVDIDHEEIWHLVFSVETQKQAYVTWYWGGIQSSDGKPPISIALLLEERNLALAEEIGRDILLESFDRK